MSNTVDLTPELAGLPSVLPPLKVCQQARLSRDPRFDGRFFVGVLSTGIYCRPICPARLPKEANVRYYATAAAAQEAGFRPCRRCRPEAANMLPEWTLASDTVLRGLRLIEAGYLNDHGTAELAAALEVGERHLARLFAQELGAAPKSIARLCRARHARDLLLQSTASLTDIAYHAGYGSLSRFNAEIRAVFECTPGALRQRVGKRGTAVVTVKLPVRQPYNFDWVFTYLQGRALKGVEEVTGDPGCWRYRRRLDREDTWLEVRQAGDGLIAHLPLAEQPLHSLLRRIRRVFDLTADGATIHEFLGSDAALKRWVTQAPGLRVPGAWDGFETAVRAVLGQQVSVARGTELANKMIDRYGEGAFPAPAQLLHREVAELGMPGRRGRAVVRLAELAVAGDLEVDECQDYDLTAMRLEAIDGIGPWTANYIRMRAMKDPNAFPDNDWVVLKELGCTAAQARKKAQAWQPWRAYALMYLWFAAGVKRQSKQSA